MDILKKEKILEIIYWCIGIILFVFIIKNYFRPFILIVILFFLGNPINKFLREKIKYKEVCAGITILLINIVVVIGIIYIWSNFYSFISTVIGSNINQIKEIFIELENGIEKIIGNINIIDSAKKILNFNYLKVGAINTGEGLLSYFIGNICTFFILADKDEIKEVVKKIMPDKVEKRVNRIIYNSRNIIKIQILLVLISTIIIIIGFKILRVENCVTLGIVCGILDILPYVGTIIVFIPIIIYNIIVKNYLIAFGLVCLYLLIQIIREILEAKLVSDKFNMHPLLSLLSLYIGAKVFGFIGIFIGPIFCMTLVDIISEN